jgi:hypothetical protein
MKPGAIPYTVAMPWYEREDFAALRAMAVDAADAPADYDEWHRKATAVARTYLSRGDALMLVTIRQAEFAQWLSERKLESTAQTRLRYVEELAKAGKSVKSIQPGGA